MTEQERRLQAVHHIVHDYANLVSSGTMAACGHHLGRPFDPPVNTHIAHAFLVNCRKMYEFFMYKPSTTSDQDDVRAAHFLTRHVAFDLSNWASWHDAMNKQLMHVTFARVEKPKKWEGNNENELFLAEFVAAWKTLRSNLEEPYKSRFDSEISEKLTSEFRGLDLW